MKTAKICSLKEDCKCMMIHGSEIVGCEFLPKLQPSHSKEEGKAYDLIKHLERQIAFSTKTFGPHNRWKGVIDHIRQELKEIEADPTDLIEWVDIILLALDGAWRIGKTPLEIVSAIDAKLTKNENREWPDWRIMDTDKAINHDRAGEQIQPSSKEVEEWCIGDKFTTPETDDKVFTVKSLGKSDVTANDARSRSGESSFLKSYITKVTPPFKRRNSEGLGKGSC